MGSDPLCPSRTKDPKVDRLEQNHPKPFSLSTTIKYGLSRTAHMTLTVYDVVCELSELFIERGEPEYL